MEPEKKSREKEIPLGNHRFQVPCGILGEYIPGSWQIVSEWVITQLPHGMYGGYTPLTVRVLTSWDIIAGQEIIVFVA